MTLETPNKMAPRKEPLPVNQRNLMPERPEIPYFNPLEHIEIGLNRLPHWDQAGKTYFITFRLGDSLPAEFLRKFQAEESVWLAVHPEPWTSEEDAEYQQRFRSQIETCLDQGHGACVLRNPDCARVMAETLAHFENERTVLHAWVVMPNHVHVLATLLKDHTLPDVLQSWKGYTAKQINAHLGKTGSLWQKSYYDRLIRNEEHFARVVRYIRHNPLKAKLRPGEYLSGESDHAKSH